MKTGIEKFKNVISDETCDLLIDHIEKNMDKAADLKHLANGVDVNNVVCRQLVLEHNSNLDNLVYKSIAQAAKLYAQEYETFLAVGDTGYQLRRISGATRPHIDNTYDSNHPTMIRTASVILGLNSDYEDGKFHFPLQNFSTTVKRGEAIVFPVYLLPVFCIPSCVCL